MKNFKHFRLVEKDSLYLQEYRVYCFLFFVFFVVVHYNTKTLRIIFLIGKVADELTKIEAIKKLLTRNFLSSLKCPTDKIEKYLPSKLTSHSHGITLTDFCIIL